MADSPSNILRRARIAAGFETAADAARHFGWAPVTYTAHESGTRGIRAPVAKKYAEAFKVSANLLMGLPGQRSSAEQTAPTPTIEVAGEAAWGIWREKQAQELDDEELHVPGLVGTCHAVRLTDDSFDRAISKGEWAFYRPISIEHQFSVDEYVVVFRSRHELTEVTVQRIVEIDGDILHLAANSTHSRYTATTVYDPAKPGDLEIRGVVVGIYNSIV